MVSIVYVQKYQLTGDCALLLITTLFDCYYSYIMSSITRQNYRSFKNYFQELWTRVQQQMESFKQANQSAEVVQQIVWQQFEEDVKLVIRIVANLSEILEEQWSNLDKLETFIRNLESDNTQLFEQNNRNIVKLQESQSHKAELNRTICELKDSIDLLSQKDKQMKILQWNIDHQNSNNGELKQLKLQISQLQKEVQQIRLQKTELSQELCLKNTEIELAILVIQDLRQKSSKQKPQTLLDTACQQNWDSNSRNSASSSHKKVYKRHNSLLQDMAQSQFIYDPKLSSKMFQSTETIQQGIEDYQYEIGNIQIASRIKALGKKSKSISTIVKPQITNVQTQTEANKPFYERCFGIMKNKIVSQRIRR